MTEREFEEFLRLPEGAVSHIPIYARRSAFEAIAKVRRLEEESLLRPGIYYIVLVDLVESTLGLCRLGPELGGKRIENFIIATVEALGRIDHRSYSQYLKEVGDASLFLFATFEDVLAWWIEAKKSFDSYNQEFRHELEDDEFQYFEIRARAVVHVGEVGFSSNNSLVSVAVNQVFKIEKNFQSGELGITDDVLRISRPIIEQCQLTPILRGQARLPGNGEDVRIWSLIQGA